MAQYSTRYVPQNNGSEVLVNYFTALCAWDFWVGILLFGINKWTELFTFDYTLANAFILGWLSSGTCYLLGVLINDFGFKVTFKNEGDCHHD